MVCEGHGERTFHRGRFGEEQGASHQRRCSRVIDPRQFANGRIIFELVGLVTRQLVWDGEIQQWAQNQRSRRLNPEDETLGHGLIHESALPITLQDLTAIRTQPYAVVSSPAKTAPDATPVVYPALVMPIHNPRRFVLAKSSTKMSEVLNRPPLPAPAIARPARKPARDLAAAVTNSPAESNVQDHSTYTRGVKIADSLPASGVMHDIPICGRSV